MIDLSQYYHKRPNLEELLHSKDEGNAKTELALLDFLIGVIDSHYSKMDQELDEIIEMIRNPNGDIAEISHISQIKGRMVMWNNKYKHDPAYLIVIGADLDVKADKAHMFRGNYTRPCIDNSFGDAETLDDFSSVQYQDGAALLTREGTVQATNVQLVNVNPYPILEQKYGGVIPESVDKTNPDEYGFKQMVNTRHFAALGTSFHMPHTTVYTLGERIESHNGHWIIEPGHIRRYEQGRITFSTHPFE